MSFESDSENGEKGTMSSGMAQRKALILVDHIGGGGTLAVVTAYARFLNKNQFQCYLNGACFTDVIKGTTPPAVQFNTFLWCIKSLIYAVLYDRNKYDIISAHSPKSLIFGTLHKAIRSRGARVIFTLHWPVDSHRMMIPLKRALYKTPDKIHSISTSISEIFAKRYSVPKDNIFLLFPMIDCSRFKPLLNTSRLDILTKLKVDINNPIIGYVGRLDYEKNVEFLIRFAEDYGHITRPVSVLIYGDGPEKAKLLMKLNSLSGPSNIRYMGFTPTPEIAFGIMDLNVLPSLVEAFPLAVAEAGLCETPTLRSSVEGSLDQIIDGQTGFLFDINGGYNAFYDRLAGILDDIGYDRTNFEPKLREIGHRSRQHFLDICNQKRFFIGCQELFGLKLKQFG